MSKPSVTVRDNPQRSRYEIFLEGDLAGYSTYTDRRGTRVFTHTEIDPDYEGKGIGSQLAKGVLTDVIGRGLAVTVRCPFITAYLRRHKADYPTMDFKTNRIPAASQA